MFISSCFCGVMTFVNNVFLNISVRIWLIMGLDAQNRCVLDDKDVENPCEDEASMWCEGANGVNSVIKS